MLTSLVTGANQGIGYEIAKGLLKTQKFRVILACRNEERASEAAKKLVEETKCKESNVMVLGNFDLAKPESIQTAAEFITKTCSTAENKTPIDVLVNNAGFAFNVDATESTGEQAEYTVGINYFGTQTVCQYFIPLVRDGGRVVNVSSRAGLINNFKDQKLIDLFNDAPKSLTLPKLDEMMKDYIKLARESKHIEAGWPSTTYQTSKIAESALTRLLAIDAENAKRNLKINCYTPGYCQSNMTCWAEDAKRSCAQGAETGIWLSVDDGVTAKTTGNFFDEEQQIISYFDGKKI